MSCSVATEVQRSRDEIRAAARDLRESGLPVPDVAGKLLRPRVAFAGAQARGRQSGDAAVRLGALALQMVHEASLLHDDIVDEAAERRGRPTVAAKQGVPTALVLGDHLLTAAYRAAARTRAPAFLDRFIRAVEETVAGELAQARSTGRSLTPAEYEAIVEKKSGALFGCALALGADLDDAVEADALDAIGRAVGVLYQMVDDFLDYCPWAAQGKPPLQDLRQRKWTWPLAFLPVGAIDDVPTVLQERLLRGGPDAPLKRALAALRSRAVAIKTDLRRALGHEARVGAMLEEWLGTCDRALQEAPWPSPNPEWDPAGKVAVEVSRQRPRLEPAPAPDPRLRVMRRASAVGGSAGQGRYFRRHSRSFSLAARLFPRDAWRLVSAVYAFCRFTDDLVDGRSEPVAEIEAELDAWLELTREAYHTRQSGVEFLDQAMGLTADRAVSIEYAETLIEGVRWDLTRQAYSTMSELDGYCFRVASVVGGWMTELFGHHEPDLLERAFALGRAMQITNILRDVGEDLDAGRLYLPFDLLAWHDIEVDQLWAFRASGSPLPEGYPALLEELMAIADHAYAWSAEALPALVPHFARPVAVAARVYQGIHDRIRANDYDNLTRRAHTSPARKIRLSGEALLDLARRRNGSVRVPLGPQAHAAPADFLLRVAGSRTHAVRGT